MCVKYDLKFDDIPMNLITTIKDRFQYNRHNLDYYKFNLILQRMRIGEDLSYFHGIPIQHHRDVIVAIMLCDVYATKTRLDRHHAKIADELEYGSLADWFKDLCKQYKLSRNIILDAVFQHRSSYDKDFSSDIAMIVNCACRGYPIVGNKVLKLKNKFNIDDVDAIEKLKYYYSDDYLNKLPKLYKVFFEKELESFRKNIKNLTSLI